MDQVEKEKSEEMGKGLVPACSCSVLAGVERTPWTYFPPEASLLQDSSDGSYQIIRIHRGEWGALMRMWETIVLYY